MSSGKHDGPQIDNALGETDRSGRVKWEQQQADTSRSATGTKHALSDHGDKVDAEGGLLELSLALQGPMGSGKVDSAMSPCSQTPRNDEHSVQRDAVSRVDGNHVVPRPDYSPLDSHIPRAVSVPSAEETAEGGLLQDSEHCGDTGTVLPSSYIPTETGGSEFMHDASESKTVSLGCKLLDSEDHRKCSHRQNADGPAPRLEEELPSPTMGHRFRPKQANDAEQQEKYDRELDSPREYTLTDAIVNSFSSATCKALQTPPYRLCSRSCLPGVGWGGGEDILHPGLFFCDGSLRQRCRMQGICQ